MQTFNTNQPNIQPANNDTLVGAVKFALPEYMKGLNTVMPAKIINFDRTINRAQVQVLINVVSTGNQQIQNVQIASVPTLILGGGGFMLSFPLNPGDLGWLIATDRDMSLFLQNYQAAAPGVFLQRNFASSYFIPDIMTNYTIASEDSDNFVIQKSDGTVKISLSNNAINIVAPNTITLTSPSVIINAETTINGGLVLNGDMSGSGTIGADYIIPQSGTLYVEGSIEAEGSITPDVPPP